MSTICEEINPNYPNGPVCAFGLCGAHILICSKAEGSWSYGHYKNTSTGVSVTNLAEFVEEIGATWDVRNWMLKQGAGEFMILGVSDFEGSLNASVL